MGARADPRGILVAVEGIDGAGKTTQVARIVERLGAHGLDVVRTKEPTDGPWGRQLRQSAASRRLSPEDELAAFMADRRDHVRDVIEPALANGQIVVVDRYYFSTAAYQGARGMDPQSILAQNESFAPRPDVLFILDLPPAVGVERIRGRGDVANLFERAEDLARARAIFLAIDRPHHLIDATRSPAAITEEMLLAIYSGPLFRRLCLKSHYKSECEPAFCSYRIDGSCDFVGLGQLVPLPPRG